MTGESLDNGIPILITSNRGSVIRKDISHYKILCPECRIPAEYTQKSEPVCPDCGIICVGQDIIREERVIRDAKAAGRLEGGKEETPA